MPRLLVYGADLAYIHASGFSELAEAAAREVLGHVRAGTIVDLGCGSGALLAALPRRFDKIGIDVSRAMLELARRNVPTATFIEASATAPIPDCDVVTAVGEVFSFAAAAEGRDAVGRAFQHIHDALRPGGLLLFDVASPGRAPEPTRATREGKGWRVEATACEDGDTLIRTIDTWRGGQHQREVHQVALLEEAWVLERLHEVGFRAASVGAYDDHALQVGWDAYEAHA